jgi:hypothetical protein
LNAHGEQHENERRFAVFEGLERALDNQIRAGERKSHAKRDQRSRHKNRLSDAHRRQQRENDRNGHHHESDREIAHDHTHIAQRLAEIDARFGDIMIADRTGYIRENRGCSERAISEYGNM